MPKRSIRPQGLDECIPSISSITSRNVSQKSVKEVGDLYLASLSLLYHLKADQVKLEQWHTKRGTSQDDIAVTPPSPDETPAMNVVLQDPRLFRALLACLKAPSNDSSEHSSGADPSSSFLHRMPQNSYSMPQQANRKRSMSYVLEHDSNSNNNASSAANGGPPMKSLKMMHSPTPPGRSGVVQKSDTTTMAATDHRKKPHWNIPVVAACIFYAAYAHLDHWPVALVQAYAEDCFGARCWVDAEECRLLVQNLALVHTTSSTESMVVEEEETNHEERSKEAPVVAEYFHYLENTDLPSIPCAAATTTSLSPTTTSTSFMRRGSLSSDAGSVSAILPLPLLKYLTAYKANRESVFTVAPFLKW